MDRHYLAYLLKEYPNKKLIHIKYASTIDQNMDMQAPEAMKSNFEQFAMLEAAPLQPGDPRLKLMPLNDYKQYIINRDVIIVSSRFYSIYVKSHGGGRYTADQVNTIIEDSLTSPNYAYNMAGQRFTSFSGHQPNFFNPKIIVNNNQNIYNGVDNTFINDVNKSNAALGMQSIGLELPHEHFPMAYVKQCHTIDVYAQHCQILDIDHLAWFQLYPVIAELVVMVL